MPALEATLGDLGVDLRSQRTSSSISRIARARPRARSASPIEIPDRVVLVIKPQGGPDDWRALFHEAGHTEHLRAHVGVAHGRGAAARRQRRHRGLGDAARAPDDRPCLARAAARLPAAARVCGRGRDGAALAAAPLLREAHLRGRVPSRGRRDGDAAALRRAARGRAEGDAERHRLPRRHRRGLLRVAVPAGVGVRSAAPRRTCASSSATRGSRARRPARCCASSGPRARSRPRTRSSPTSPARRSSSTRSPTGSARRWRRRRTQPVPGPALRLRPRAPAARQRADAELPVRHGRAHRRQRARVVLGALPPGRRRPRVQGRLLPVRAARAVPGRRARAAVVRGRLHRDVHARELGAHRRQHALPLDLRQQRRGGARPCPVPRLVPRRRGRGDGGADGGHPLARQRAATRASRTSARAARSRPCSARTSCSSPAPGC